MNVRESLVRNTVWYGLVTGVGLLSGLIMSVLLARGLGPTRMGEYSYILWAARTMTALAMMGFAVATVRYTAAAIAQGDRALAWGFVHLLKRRQIIATLIVIAVGLPLLMVFAPANLRWPLVIMCIALFPATVEYIYSNSVYGAQRYDLTAQASTIKMIVQLTLSVIVLALGFGIIGLVTANLITSTVSCTLQRRRSQSVYPKTPAPVPPDVLPELRRFLVPLSVVTVLDALVWDRSPVFFLQLWGSPHDIAYYSLAFGLAATAMIIPQITVGGLLPAFSALHGSGAVDEFRRVYRTALRYVLLAGAPIAATSIATAPTLITFLYGDVYLPVARLFSVLIAVAMIAVMRSVAWAALRGLGDRKWAVIATGVSAVVSIATAVLLVGRFGTWGAVAANGAAQLVATTWVLVVMAKTYRCGFPALDATKIVLAAMIALVAGLAITGPGIPRLVLTGLVVPATYLGACLLSGVVGQREWQFLLTSTRRFATRPA